MKRKRSADKLMPRYKKEISQTVTADTDEVNASDTTDNINDDMAKYKYKILNMAHIFNESESEFDRWDISTFNKITGYLSNINVALQEKLDNIGDERIFFYYLKNSVNNAAIECFSTERRCDTAFECYDRIWGNFNKNKLNAKNIKEFSDAVNKVIESYNIVLAALKSRNILIPEKIDKIIEHLCPGLSKMGYEYLKENNKYLVEEVCTQLNNKRTPWSKLGDGFTISSKNLERISKKITNSHENKKHDDAQLYSSLPILDCKEEITKPCDNKENNAMSRFHKLYRSFSHSKRHNSKEDTTNSFNPRESKKHLTPLNKKNIGSPIINPADSMMMIVWKVQSDNQSLLNLLASKSLDPSDKGSDVLGKHIETSDDN